VLRRRRSLRLALFATAIAVLSTTTAAWALGELGQKPGAAGCFGGPAADACGEGRVLNGAEGVAVSPDGGNVYVAADGSDAIGVFDRDPATGALNQKPGATGCVSKAGEGCEKAILEGATDVVVSPDGGGVYVATGNGMAIFDRGPDGSLTQKPGMDGCISQFTAGCRPGRALFRGESIAISPDGTSVYLAGARAVAIFDRDLQGRLTQKPGAAGCVGLGGTDGENQACLAGHDIEVINDVTVSPDGRSVYVASGASNAIAILDRQPDGGLSQKPGKGGCVARQGVEGCEPGRELEDPRAVAVSPDGRNVYVGASRDHGVAILDRGPDGSLTQKPGMDGCISQFTAGCQPGRHLAPSSLSVSPDGASVYAASFGSLGVAVFDRDPAGRLTQRSGTAGCISADGSDGCEKGRGVHDPFGVATSPDGRSVYVVSSQVPGALAIFDRAVLQSPPPRDTVAPGVSGFKLAPARFRVRSKRGTSFRFSLTEPASVRISIERVRPRRRVAALTFRGRPQGANRIRFRGRVKKRPPRPLRPGAYRATIVATDAAGNSSQPRRARFTVLPADI
jgi:DNA-binding beta-propeller fold protein YncE